MHSTTSSDVVKKPSRLAWLLFAAGISLVPIGAVIYTLMTGVSPWLSPHRKQADRFFWVFLITAYVLCALAPFFARASGLRRLGVGLVAVIAVASIYFLCAMLHLYLIGA